MRILLGSPPFLDEGYGAFASRSTVLGGSAVFEAANALLAEIRAAAGARLGCAAEQVEVEDGYARAPDGRSLAFAELAEDGLRVTTAFGNDNRLTYTYGSAAAPGGAASPIIGGIRPPKSGSHPTLRWRKPDSNHRSLSRKCVGALRRNGYAAEVERKRGRHSRGTDGSNPVSSRSESYANLNSSICELRPRLPARSANGFSCARTRR